MVHKRSLEMLSVTGLRKQVHHIRYCKLQESVFLRGEMLRLCQKVKWKRVQQRDKDLVCAKKACLIVSTVLHFFFIFYFLAIVVSLLVSHPATLCLEVILQA